MGVGRGGKATSCRWPNRGGSRAAKSLWWERPAVAQLELRRVRKSYQSVEAVRGVDLTIANGSFTIFVGPSGCGKSTLLRMIAGLETLTGGEIWLDGLRCDPLLPSARGMAMVFQS